MNNELSYTIEEVAQLLKVSKLTIYDLVKKGELPVFRVGRQMRMHAKDLEDYITQKKSTISHPPVVFAEKATSTKESSQIVISGQDMVLDILGRHLEKATTKKILRSHAGSLNGLISMYKGECDIVSVHMYDGDTGEYNLPYIKKILTGFPYVLVNLLCRKAGFYVQAGNPLNVQSWEDLKRKDITIMNREKGSGARILLDEHLRLCNISTREVAGYENEESNHLSVASAVSTGAVDIGIGMEKAAKLVGVDFIPLIRERYDLVLLKTNENAHFVNEVMNILTSKSFQSEINAIGDYDTSQTGSIMYETF
ncbi:substrate-binding domain-containing protein [Robertmurraya kyonggiensis]|uniref:Helix-turn-helix domain-containing protein n=1 Tax=Robertmurraya kyonggiensis TaxID=1037680 RepID=A0A4U1D379_9BACI|nr:helix-turn-helix transcriptional regulator [Robertmurraya kyonggiensis]TKC16792.1 helix-turn-helix domain-containing protein [Robertmurraya kyonggiensis]